MTQELAEQISEVARLLEQDEDSDATLRRLTDLGVGLVPGASAASMTIATGDPPPAFAASDPRLDELHRLQFGRGQGPVVETLRHNEARHVHDTRDEDRWPVFCEAAASAGFGSCLVLPLRTDRRPAGAVALYASDRGVFHGTSHDLALLFAAQGGTAVHNATLYRAARKMVCNLHTALESRAVIEQAKARLQAEFGVSADEAFQLLSRTSQRTNKKVRKIAAELVAGEIGAERFRPAKRPRPAP